MMMNIISPTSIATPAAEPPIIMPRSKCEDDGPVKACDEELEGEDEEVWSESTLQTSLIYTRVSGIDRLTNTLGNRRELGKGPSTQPFRE
jgi:hypothetical protein